MLGGRRVLLAVSGGVAAYKSAYLARRLIESGADVEVILTDAAKEFVGAQTFAAITGRQPHTSLFGDERVSPHTELARWADLVIVAPATASTMAKLATGQSSDLLSATLLATTSPTLLAPAMHTEMWEHPATRRNVATLVEDGHRLVGPEDGPLAGGDVGPGRVAEPEDIVAAAIDILSAPNGAGRMLVTAGGTREPVDPVRFLGNRSSGKMGHAIATAGAQRGYDVTLVTTASLAVPPSVEVIQVETAQEMLAAVETVDADVAVMAAAVADFRPAVANDTKLARSEGLDSIALEPNPDILAAVGSREPRPFLVGFAAETGGTERAVEKAARKGVDILVYNDVTEAGSGFGTDTNRVALIGADGSVEEWPMMPKAEVASRLVDRIFEQAARKQ